MPERCQARPKNLSRLELGNSPLDKYFNHQNLDTLFMNEKGTPSVCTFEEHYPDKIIRLATAFMVLLLIVACSSASGRNRSDVSGKLTADQFISHMTTQLYLTEKQELQIRPVVEADFKKRKAIIDKYHGKGRDSRDALRAELQELKISTESDIVPFLTDEQMDKFRKLYDQKLQTPSKRKGRGGRRRF